MKTKIAAIFATLFPVAGSAAAAPADITVTKTYRASYDAKRDRFCVKFYSSFAEGPRPGPIGQRCLVKAEWAKEGITITRRPRVNFAAR